MKPKFFTLLFIFTFFGISCKDRKPTPSTSGEKIHPTEQTEAKTEVLKIDSTAVIAGLQGKWKEPEYPFRLAYFKDSTVKFIEEGVAEKPEFKEFRILSQCLFDTNNMVGITASDTILVIPEDERCEKLSVTQDTLILIGYNSATSSNYHIIYIKQAR
ncbi:hypothetical protein [Salinimicrobium sp. WS361]|uniref:hypothetical protein n=1 Tax=Salinimicrobium sp. WS361 TaxID=3425123 RepID=UPI003D6F2A7D